MYQDRCVLLPGDTNARGYAGIPQEKLQADLFKIGHHGQKDGISGELLKIISPEAVVCCASSDRRYDSAHPDVVRMLEGRGYQTVFFGLSSDSEWGDTAAPGAEIYCGQRAIP